MNIKGKHVLYLLPFQYKGRQLKPVFTHWHPFGFFPLINLYKPLQTVAWFIIPYFSSLYCYFVGNVKTALFNRETKSLHIIVNLVQMKDWTFFMQWEKIIF